MKQEVKFLMAGILAEQKSALLLTRSQRCIEPIWLVQEEFARGDQISSQILSQAGPVIDWDRLLEPDSFFQHFKNYLQVG